MAKEIASKELSSRDGASAQAAALARGPRGVYPRVNFEIIEDWGELHDALATKNVKPGLMVRIHLDIPVDESKAAWGKLQAELRSANPRKDKVREAVLELAREREANPPSNRGAKTIEAALPD